MASNTPHNLATEHLPMFVSGPGETDVFFIVVVVIVILVAMLFGALYLTLHALPEKMLISCPMRLPWANRRNKKSGSIVTSEQTRNSSIGQFLFFACSSSDFAIELNDVVQSGRRTAASRSAAIKK